MDNFTQSPDPAQAATEIGRFLIDVDMFPVFFMAHFCIACLMIREDSKDLGPKFQQNHPMASWVSSVLTSLAGVIVTNFLFGDAVVDIIKEDRLIIFVTVIWYLMNYGPFDLLYKVVRMPPVYIVMAMLQENLRVRCIFQALEQVGKAYPGAIFIVLLAGVVNGNGYGYLKIVERLIRGKWTPGSNDFLEVTYLTKSSVYASVAFMLQASRFLLISVEITYLTVVVLFMIFRLLMTVTPNKDPLLPLEMPICKILFGTAEPKKRVSGGRMENGRVDDKKKH
ncbi:trimeric intracellular cation channel type b-a [Plakobranchus ocellatus]|uniref:Trimeric intracellular cation channel type b-a n=1 Tax=Plakobranchus ocellatus TaxID=259542 RepID=A0AAV4AV98_9GAST|nr:trimeric intracellular cation channel type b-a [Plakobranchus ocellatus]